MEVALAGRVEHFGSEVGLDLERRAADLRHESDLAVAFVDRTAVRDALDLQQLGVEFDVLKVLDRPVTESDAGIFQRQQRQAGRPASAFVDALGLLLGRLCRLAARVGRRRQAGEIDLAVRFANDADHRRHESDLLDDRLLRGQRRPANVGEQLGERGDAIALALVDAHPLHDRLAAQQRQVDVVDLDAPVEQRRDLILQHRPQHVRQRHAHGDEEDDQCQPIGMTAQKSPLRGGFRRPFFHRAFACHRGRIIIAATHRRAIPRTGPTVHRSRFTSFGAGSSNR